jgi:hypothetical protein
MGGIRYGGLLRGIQWYYMVEKSWLTPLKKCNLITNKIIKVFMFDHPK